MAVFFLSHVTRKPTTWYHMQPVHILFLLRVSICPKSCENRVSHTWHVTVSHRLWRCYVNGVLQYTRITALCNTSEIVLAVKIIKLFTGPNMLVPDFEIIITKTFPATLMLSPFGFVVWRHGQRQEQKVCYSYYYRRRMQMSLQDLIKSPRTFVIPLQSSRNFVYA